VTNQAKYFSPVLNDPYPILALTIHGNKSKLIINILKRHVLSTQMLADRLCIAEVTTAMKNGIEFFQKTLKTVKEKMY